MSMRRLGELADSRHARRGRRPHRRACPRAGRRARQVSAAAAPVCLRSPVTAAGAYRALLPNGRLTSRRREGRSRDRKRLQTRSFCRLCPAYCGIVVTHEGDRVVGVQGDRDHPVSTGLHVPQGAGARRAPSPPAAARRAAPAPQRAASSRSRGRSCSTTSRRSCRRTLDEHGPAAVGAYFGTAAVFDANLYWAGARFLKRLGSPSKFTSGTIDAPSYPVVRRLMAGVGWLFHSIDFERATMTIFLGTNPVVSHNSHMQGFPNPTARIRELARRGEVWVVDARRTETAKLATRHLALLPRHRLRAARVPRPGAAARRRRPRVPRRPRDAGRRAAARPSSASTRPPRPRITGLAPDDLATCSRRCGATAASPCRRAPAPRWRRPRT